MSRHHSNNHLPLAPLEPAASIHVGIIMDGNGRWAAARGRPRSAGHMIGAQTVRTIVENAPALGIGTLTLYAFSSDNWKRPSREVAMLMRLFRRYLLSEVDRCIKNSVRLRIVGRRDRIPSELRKTIESAEAATRDGTTLDLRVAVDYSARDTIVRAAAHLARLGSAARLEDADSFAQAINDVSHAGPARPVDLLIRTGGEQRLSDFLLWECAYAELYFTQRMWPDFAPADLAAAVQEFQNRERRYGAIPYVSQPEVAAVAG